MILPGDELIGDPAAMTTLAVPIEAPAADVWPWLLQIGQDRAGFYSYDALENLVGLHIHSADQIVDQWQTLTVGDRVRLTPRAGWDNPTVWCCRWRGSTRPAAWSCARAHRRGRGTPCGPSMSCRPQPAAAA